MVAFLVVRIDFDGASVMFKRFVRPSDLDEHVREAVLRLRRPRIRRDGMPPERQRIMPDLRLKPRERAENEDDHRRHDRCRRAHEPATRSPGASCRTTSRITTPTRSSWAT